MSTCTCPASVADCLPATEQPLPGVVASLCGAPRALVPRLDVRLQPVYARQRQGPRGDDRRSAVHVALLRGGALRRRPSSRCWRVHRRVATAGSAQHTSVVASAAACSAMNARSTNDPRSRRGRTKAVGTWPSPPDAESLSGPARGAQRSRCGTLGVPVSVAHRWGSTAVGVRRALSRVLHLR